MYFKLATQNIKKSFKDYTIYFLTLILAVCIFYSFNSIDSQKALLDIKSSNAKNMERLIDIMAYVSVFISVILGSLILYANNFLIKKRKKELGIYMTLGMGKRKISRILVTETCIVGAISLIAGLIIGIGASQGLATFTLKLFEVGMDEYKFAISTGAIGKTILYFGIMFLLVMIFNVFIISKYKIIDLLIAGRKNENIKFKNPVIYIISFVLCVASLAFGYKSLLKIGLDSRNYMFIPALVLSIVGTVLFFFSLSGVILYIVNKNKNLYLKGLNIFVVKQINSKVNTNFISMSLICLMLFITIIVLSTGISLKKDYEIGLEKETPFDASITVYNHSKEESIEDILEKINFKKSGNEKYEVLNEYYLDGTAENLLKVTDEDYKDYGGKLIKISDYNKMLKLKGEQEVSLNKDEVLFLSTFNKLIKPVNERLKDNNKVYIKDKEYLVKNDKIIEDNLHTYMFADNFFAIVINDEVLSDYDKNLTSVLNVMYSDKNREENNKKYTKIEEDNRKGEYKDLNIPNINSFSKDDLYNKSKGSSTAALFMGMYLGIVFLITSMAILALQQLSEASDSIERYKALKRIGANKKMINKTIFIQTLVYFSLPVILALMHSVIGVTIIDKEVGAFTEIDIKFSVLITTLVFMVVYIVYFYTTYSGYKNIVKNSI
ncbi:putative ABC transport system permease protein [Clostridium cavendishii DSM 21758]|uniref:Putative ABC transport system permease protein n=1 Tax=Clostridium cavendishii DSM 21758 TaxID=1121302 RepID=A0A1M6UHI5_9CLOT|nr:ABC transporter permease [Clostridium cavendishii]SHK68725.1 putative ABC transport system permease protein [Clostridium cavendishii DSM 21758]